MDLDLAPHNTYALWFMIWFVIVVPYPFLVVPLMWSSRGRKSFVWQDPIPILVASLPARISLVAVFLGLRNLLLGIDRFGGTYRAASAAAAEIQLTLALGFASSFLVSIFLAMHSPSASCRSRRAIWVLLPVVLLSAGELAVCWFVGHPQANVPTVPVTISNIGIALASLSLVLTGASLVRQRMISSAEVVETPCAELIGLSIALGVLAVLSWVCLRYFSGLAASGG